MKLEIPERGEGPKGRGVLEMRRAGWYLGVSHGAGAAAQVPNAHKICWYAPEGFIPVPRSSKACEVFKISKYLEAREFF